MMRDLHNSIYASLGLAPVAAVTNDTAFVSQIVDTANFQTTEFLGVFGTNTDSDCTFTVLVEDGDSSILSDNAAVADGYLLGVEAMSLNYASDNKVFKIGYRGPKRYVRVTVTPSGNTGNVFLAGIWLQSGARKGPKSTQVV